MHFLLAAASRTVGTIPEAFWDRLAWGLSFLLFSVFRLRRRVIMKNLAIAFGSETSLAQRAHMGRMCTYHFLLTLFECLGSVSRDLTGRITMHNLDYIKPIVDSGSGAYIICCHMGNWEALGASVNRYVGPTYAIVKRVGGPAVNRFVEEFRERVLFRTIKRQKKGDAYRAIKEIIARGEMIGFVMDQARPGEPKLPFFGEPAKTNTSLAAIHQRNPAPIIPAYIVRTGIGQHDVFFEKPLEDLPEHDDPAEQITLRSAYFNRVLESMIEKNPQQYLWFHDRWKV